jgi:hypothetical protein
VSLPTNAEIRAIRAAAAHAGDRAQVAICLRAEGWERDDFAAKVEWAASLTGRKLDSDAERVCRISVSAAKMICASVIAEAAAQQ